MAEMSDATGGGGHHSWSPPSIHNDVEYWREKAKSQQSMLLQCSLFIKDRKKKSLAKDRRIDGLERELADTREQLTSVTSDRDGLSAHRQRLSEDFDRLTQSLQEGQQQMSDALTEVAAILEDLISKQDLGRLHSSLIPLVQPLEQLELLLANQTSDIDTAITNQLPAPSSENSEAKKPVHRAPARSSGRFEFVHRTIAGSEASGSEPSSIEAALEAHLVEGQGWLAQPAEPQKVIGQTDGGSTNQSEATAASPNNSAGDLVLVEAQDKQLSETGGMTVTLYESLLEEANELISRLGGGDRKADAMTERRQSINSPSSSTTDFSRQETAQSPPEPSTLTSEPCSTSGRENRHETATHSSDEHWAALVRLLVSRLESMASELTGLRASKEQRLEESAARAEGDEEVKDVQAMFDQKLRGVEVKHRQEIKELEARLSEQTELVELMRLTQADVETVKQEMKRRYEQDVASLEENFDERYDSLENRYEDKVSELEELRAAIATADRQPLRDAKVPNLSAEDKEQQTEPPQPDPRLAELEAEILELESEHEAEKRHLEDKIERLERAVREAKINAVESRGERRVTELRSSEFGDPYEAPDRLAPPGLAVCTESPEHLVEQEAWPASTDESPVLFDHLSLSELEDMKPPSQPAVDGTRPDNWQAVLEQKEREFYFVRSQLLDVSEQLRELEAEYASQSRHVHDLNLELQRRRSHILRLTGSLLSPTLPSAPSPETWAKLLREYNLARGHLDRLAAANKQLTETLAKAREVGQKVDEFEEYCQMRVSVVEAEAKLSDTKQQAVVQELMAQATESYARARETELQRLEAEVIHREQTAALQVELDASNHAVSQWQQQYKRLKQRLESRISELTAALQQAAEATPPPSNARGTQSSGTGEHDSE